MKDFFRHFFGMGTEPEFALLTPAHIAPILLLAAALFLLYRYRGNLRNFRHETNLLITAGEKAVLLAGCAHSGIVPIMQRCEALLGRAPDIVLGGFHLFSPGSGETEPEEVIRGIGRKLAQWPSHYYTGHCTGEKAYQQLSSILEDRLHPLSGGLKLVIE